MRWEGAVSPAQGSGEPSEAEEQGSVQSHLGPSNVTGVAFEEWTLWSCLNRPV